MDRLEALADAIMKLNGWADPTSQAYQDRNPLLLRAYSLSRAQAQDAQGIRVFTSLLGGYRAGLNDLFEKCGGGSRAKIDGDAPLQHLLGLYGVGHPLARKQAVLFLRRALPDAAEAVHALTPIGWFLQSSAVASGE